MHSNCILDSIVNLLVHHTVFVGNVQKSPIASPLKGLNPSLDFCCHGPALTGITEGRQDEHPHQLNLRSKKMFLSLHMIFSLERAALSGLSWKEYRVLILR